MKKLSLIILALIIGLSIGDNLLAQGAGNALVFDGVEDYVNCPSVSINNDNFTLEAWAKLTFASNYQWIVVIGGYTLAIGKSSGGYICALINGSTANASTSFTPTNNIWYHIALVRNSGSYTIYINGKAYSISNTNTPSSTSGLYIGGKSAGLERWQGDIDEVRIWNVVRTEAEIRANMCKTLAGNESGLVAYYKMTDGSGTSLTDNSTNSNTGTLMYDSNWVTSGAALGDASTYDYSSPSSVNLASTYGDDVTVGTIVGSPDGVQIYRVDSAPNVTTPPGDLNQLSQSHYFGVFVVGGTSPTYTLTYNYDGHPGISDEDNLELASRSNNAATSWTDLNANLNTTNNTLIKTGQSGTEYILASSSDNSLPVELSSFTAESRSGGVLLKWSTESEIENLGFLIEKQILDTGCWMEIAGYLSNSALEGHGSTTEAHDYQFTDNAVQPGVTYEYRLGDVDYSGKVTWHGKLEVKVEAESAKIPTEFGLQRAYPNPFNPTTTISYQLASSSFVKISIYDVRGKLVETLVNEQKDRGSYSVVWDAGGLSSGIYLYKIAAGEYSEVNKCLLIR